MSETIGTAYIQVEPEAKGIQSKIEEAISGGSDGFGKSLSGALGTAAKAGAAALAGATTAIGAFGASSVKAGMSFDTAMSQVAATMGVTVGEIGNLRDFAQEMGSTTAFSATEAADALNYMALAGYDADTSMKMLPNVLNLAAAGGIDLASASDMVTDAQTALGLSLDETSTMVDQMAKTSSMSNTSVQQLGDAFLTIGANARGVKGGTQELSQVLGVLADNGIKGSEAGTHLRNIMLAMNPTTDKAAAAWKKLGVDAYDAEGNLKSLPNIFLQLNNAMSDMTSKEKKETLAAMFNKTDLASVEALLGTQAERYGELARGIRGAGISLDSFKSSFKELGGDFDQVQTAINALGDANLTDALPEYLEWCEGDAQRLAQAMYEDSDASISYDDIVNALGGDLNVLQQALDNTTGAAGAMANTQLDDLQGDITLFKSALEGAQIAVSDGLAPTLREFVQFGSEGISQLTMAFKEGGLSGAMEAFGTILSDGLNMIIEMLPQMVDAGMQLLGALGQGILDNLPTIVDAAVEIVNMLVQGVMEALPALLEGGIQVILQLADGISQALPNLIPVAVETILTLVEDLLDNIDKIIDGALQLITALADGLINALPTLIEKAPIIIDKLVTAIVNNAPKLITAAAELQVQLSLGLIKAIPSLLKAIPEIIASLVSGLIEAGVQLIAAGADLIERVYEGVKKLNPAEWGRDLIDSFVDGILGAIGRVKDAAGRIAETVKSYLHFSEPDVGPLSDFHTYAPDMMKLFAEGIEDNTKVVTSAIDQMTSEMLAVGPKGNINAFTDGMMGSPVESSNSSVVYNNEFVINGYDKDPKELAKEISYLMNQQYAQVAGAWS